MLHSNLSFRQRLGAVASPGLAFAYDAAAMCEFEEALQPLFNLWATQTRASTRFQGHSVTLDGTQGHCSWGVQSWDMGGSSRSLGVQVTGFGVLVTSYGMGVISSDARASDSTKVTVHGELNRSQSMGSFTPKAWLGIRGKLNLPSSALCISSQGESTNCRRTNGHALWGLGWVTPCGISTGNFGR